MTHCRQMFCSFYRETSEQGTHYGQMPCSFYGGTSEQGTHHRHVDALSFVESFLRFSMYLDVVVNSIVIHNCIMKTQLIYDLKSKSKQLTKNRIKHT